VSQDDFEQQRLNNEIRSLKQELEDARMKNVVSIFPYTPKTAINKL
jgi:hypothetical protein